MSCPSEARTEHPEPEATVNEKQTAYAERTWERTVRECRAIVIQRCAKLVIPACMGSDDKIEEPILEAQLRSDAQRIRDFYFPL